MFPELVRVLTTKKLGKTTKQGIYKDGFFIAAGLFAGVGLNDVWRLSGSELNYKKLVVAGKESPFIEEMHMDELYQYAIVSGALMLSILFDKHVNEMIPASIGAFTGIAWSNHMERKGAAPITILPI